VLTEQKLDQSLAEWLKSLREQSSIRIPTPIERTQTAPVQQAQ